MAKKFFPRALSVGLSLALCAGMVLPSFAASFADLNKAITTGESQYNSETQQVSIEASKDEKGAVSVKLHEDVEYGGKDDAEGQHGSL